MSLNEKQERFCLEYVKDLNATQAVIRAGYSDKNADVTGPRMLGNIGVATRIAELSKPILDALSLNNESVLREVARVSFANAADFMRVDDEGNPVVDFSAVANDRDKLAAVESIQNEQRLEFANKDDDQPATITKVKFKLHSKLGALDLAMRYLGLLNSQVKVEVEMKWYAVDTDPKNIGTVEYDKSGQPLSLPSPQ